jgi:hypothetical protein
MMKYAKVPIGGAHVDARWNVGRAEVLLRLGQWLFPWLCVTGIAVLLVLAAEQEFAVSAAPVAQATFMPEPTRGESRLRWVAFHSVDASGNAVSMTCLAARSRAKEDQIYVPPDDLPDAAGSLCADLHSDP